MKIYYNHALQAVHGAERGAEKLMRPTIKIYTDHALQAVHGAERGAEEPDGAGHRLRGLQVDQHQGSRTGEDPRHLPQGHAG